MISLTVDEVVAVRQYVARLMRQGDSLRTAFWMGGTIPENEVGVDGDPALERRRVRAALTSVTRIGTTRLTRCVPWKLLPIGALP